MLTQPCMRCVVQFAPVKSRLTFASSNVFALSTGDSPRSASSENIFGNDTPKAVSSPLKPAATNPFAAPPSNATATPLLPPESQVCGAYLLCCDIPLARQRTHFHRR